MSSSWGRSAFSNDHDWFHSGAGDGGQKSLPGLDEKEISVSCLVKVRIVEVCWLLG